MPGLKAPGVLAAALLLLAAAMPALAEREQPSTPAERAKVVRLTRQLEADPLGAEAVAAQRWLVGWIQDVPDLTVTACDLLQLPDQEYPYAPQLTVQMMAGNAAFQIENPAKAGDQAAVQGAALKSALRAYGAIVKRKPAARLDQLDRLVEQMKSGRLDQRMKALVAERCESQQPDDAGPDVI
ncbi:MAG TPA: hypothetical protein VNX47_04475 [Nevskia sp.]|nr:hypothetical protein [Nevskia sp.]